MRLLTVLLLSVVSLSAGTLGVNATKIPPTRKGGAITAHTPPNMKMAATKKAAKKGNSKTLVQGGGRVAQAVSGKTPGNARKVRAKAAIPPRSK